MPDESGIWRVDEQPGRVQTTLALCDQLEMKITTIEHFVIAIFKESLIATIRGNKHD